jgi:hypothetical protein
MIDWEWAAPGTRRRDLSHAVWQWLNLGEDGPSPVEQSRRLRVVLEAYGDSGDHIIDDILDRQADWIRLADGVAATQNEYAGRSPGHWTGVASWVRQERAWLLRYRAVIDKQLGS